MNVAVEPRDGHTQVRVAGEVDMNSAPDLRRAIREAVDGGGSVMIHLGGVSYMDSAGIAVLIEGLQWSKRTGVEFALCAMPHPVRVVVELARLDSVFTILPDPEAAGA